MLPEYFEFSLSTKVIYGIGILKNPSDSIRGFGKRKAVLVTDEVILKAGPVDKVKAGFQNTDIDIVCVFDRVPPDSTIRTVEDCANLARKNDCDMFIAVGGGSVMDTAKVANLLLVCGGEAKDHMGAYVLDPNDELMPSIFIPTTAGTGSEVTRVAMIADPEKNLKLSFAEEQFLPTMAILDPEVTLSMPGKLTAATGMDALTHAVEAYVDKERSPASDALAIHAIRLISGNILQVCAHPDDIEARGAMLAGSFLAGVAFSHSMVGMVHGISHALGGVYHIPHGLANALVLPEVMEYNLDAEPDRYADIAMALGIEFPQLINQSQSLLKSGSLVAVTSKFTPADFIRAWFDTKTYSARGFAAKALGSFSFIDQWVRRQAAWAGVEKVRALNRQLAYLTNMPLNLKEAGVTDNLARLAEVAEAAMQDGAMLYNPVEPEIEAVVRIVRKLHDIRVDPLPVTEKQLRETVYKVAKKQVKNVFSDSDMLYEVIGGFFEQLKAHPEISVNLAKSEICVRFVYKNPAAIITVDTTGGGIEIYKGESEKTPQITLSMNADFAHKFWHGKADLVSAVTRRQVSARGNLPRALKLLPILKPSFSLYPKYLKEKGLGKIVME